MLLRNDGGKLKVLEVRQVEEVSYENVEMLTGRKHDEFDVGSELTIHVSNAVVTLNIVKIDEEARTLVGIFDSIDLWVSE